MNEYQIIIGPAAQEDLRGIYRYIADALVEPETAHKVQARLETHILSLRQFPQRHELVPWEPWRSRGLRKFPAENYTLFYLADPDARTVYVLRVLYGGRDIPSELP